MGGTIVTGAASASALTTVFVTNQAQFDAAIRSADALTVPGAYTIEMTADIAESSDPLAFNLHPGVSVTLDGEGHALDCGSAHRGLFVYSGDVTFENLTIQNAIALGGAEGPAIGGRRRRGRPRRRSVRCKRRRRQPGRCRL